MSKQQTTYLTDRQLDKLGIEISNKCQWSGDDIVAVFQSALEDANYHKFNKLVTAIWENYE